MPDHQDHELLPESFCVVETKMGAAFVIGMGVAEELEKIVVEGGSSWIAFADVSGARHKFLRLQIAGFSYMTLDTLQRKNRITDILSGEQGNPGYGESGI